MLVDSRGTAAAILIGWRWVPCQQPTRELQGNFGRERAVETNPAILQDRTTDSLSTGRVALLVALFDFSPSLLSLFDSDA